MEAMYENPAPPPRLATILQYAPHDGVKARPFRV
jgi:hypothetical protein